MVIYWELHLVQTNRNSREQKYDFEETMAIDINCMIIMN